jgi:hypothetical protein
MACASQIWPRAPQRDRARQATSFRTRAEVAVNHDQIPNHGGNVCAPSSNGARFIATNRPGDPEQTRRPEFSVSTAPFGRDSTAGRKCGLDLIERVHPAGRLNRRAASMERRQKSFQTLIRSLAEFLCMDLKLRERFRNPRIIIATGRYPPSPARGRPIRGAIDNYVGCASFFCAG